MRHHFHNDNDQRDALNDYLEAHVGFPPANSRADQLDTDMRGAVEEFLDLAERAGVIPAAQSHQRRSAVNATLPISGALPAPTRSTQRNRPSFTLPAWTRHLHMLSTVLLIVVVAALSFATFGPNGIGGGGSNGSGDGPGMFAAVPVATVPEDAVTSSIPYPTADECTIEPMTREELIQHYQEANVASQEDWLLRDHPLDELASNPSEEDAQTIMQTYRQWQACGLVELGPAYQMQLETPLFTANQSALFYDHEPSVSDEVIEGWVDDFILTGESPYIPATPPSDIGPLGTPIVIEELPAGVPVPGSATPVVDETGGGAYPTIFPEDIVMLGDDHAMAMVYFVDPVTREVAVISPLTYWFENVDGKWKVDFYREAGGA